MAASELDRITIDRIEPVTPSRRHAVKAVVDERVPVSADIYTDGHDQLAARVRWRPVGAPDPAHWRSTPLRDVGDDRWAGEIQVDTEGAHEVVIEAWRDRFASWRHDIEIKVSVGDRDLFGPGALASEAESVSTGVALEMEEGARLLEARVDGVAPEHRERVLEAVAALRRESCSLQVRLNAGLDDQVAALVDGIPDADLTVSPPLPLWVDRFRGGYGAWYELFPRSEGGLVGATKRLADVAEMGFDVVYLPPIHPIGSTARKGRNNTLVALPGDPGSPWAIGGPEGGHTAIDPGLGTLDDFRAFCAETADLGMEVALDYALQCSPDHPWVSEHPEWFWQRPDGSIRYAENPPKKYQDIYPLRFWPDRAADRVALWEACRDILLYWIDQGVRIFRVDNPHTKPMAFWEWMIEHLRQEHPDVVLLAEAFTRPKVMAKLAEVGFTQSYTYFTWRNTCWELRQYVEELAYGPTAHYLRPSFWPNTPDILAGPLRNGPPAAFLVRYVLAATLVPSYGIYSGYELYENEPASESNDEYLHSEKYEVRRRDWSRADSMTPFISRVNEIRHRHRAFLWLRNIRFHNSADDRFLVYSKGHAADADTGGDLMLMVVNLDPHTAHETVLDLDLGAIGLPRWGNYTAHDELGGETYTWDGPNPYIRLDPTRGQVAHILSLRRA